MTPPLKNPGYAPTVDLIFTKETMRDWFIDSEDEGRGSRAERRSYQEEKFCKAIH